MQNDLKLLPFDTLAKDFTSRIPELGIEVARQSAVDDFIKRHSINQKLSWLGYQMLAEFGTWKVGYLDNRPCAKATLHINTRASNNLFNLGLAVLAKTTRAEFFKDQKIVKQYTSILNPLVPIILAGFKASQNIKYEDWHPNTIENLLSYEQYVIYKFRQDKKFLAIKDVSQEELLNIRDQSLLIKTGARSGKQRDPKSTYALSHLKGTVLEGFPLLASHLILETWAAHPQNRSEYMIQSVDNWDVANLELIKPKVLLEDYDEWQA